MGAISRSSRKSQASWPPHVGQQKGGVLKILRAPKKPLVSLRITNFGWFKITGPQFHEPHEKVGTVHAKLSTSHIFRILRAEVLKINGISFLVLIGAFWLSCRKWCGVILWGRFHWIPVLPLNQKIFFWKPLKFGKRPRVSGCFNKACSKFESFWINPFKLANSQLAEVCFCNLCYTPWWWSSHC